VTAKEAAVEYRKLGGTGVEVSALCLGAMTFGDPDESSFMHQAGCDEATSHALLNRALDAGVNFVDTADVYGQDGLSERVVGRWFERDGRREEVILATKFRFGMGAQGPNRSGASRWHVTNRVEGSLRRLKTDRIDLYQIHMQDVTAPEDELLRALDDLVRQGKVLYVGCSNYAAYRLMESLWRSDALRLERFVTLQAQYSLLERGLEREHIPLCLKFGVGLLPWSPLAGGFLTGKFRRDQPPPDGARLTRWKQTLERLDSERSWRILDALDAVAAEHEATPAQIALAWCLAKPAVTSVIFGARSREQLDDNLKAAELTLSAEQRGRLDEASAFELGYPYDFMQRIQGRW
jgi:aryl-alcohol dehydrogenase-like predicted oxidoreductase